MRHVRLVSRLSLVILWASLFLIVQEASAETVSGTDVVVSADATDNVGVAGVQFLLDGAPLGAEDTTAPYSITWDSTTVSNGLYTLTARARDAAGNQATDSIQVTVDNPGGTPPPPVDLISNVSAVSGQNYVIGTNLSVGQTVYIDRAYSFTSVPSILQNQQYIKTANDDKGATGSSFLSFTVSQAATVYVAHDDRITNKPSWLSTFADSGLALVTSDAALSVYQKIFPQGVVSLGGNAASSDGSMYSVIVVPSSPGGGDPPLPAITVVTEQDASEVGPTAGTFTVTRTGDTSAALVVDYSVSGSATNGTDYQSLSGSVTIPQGSGTAFVDVLPLADGLAEESETVVLTLTPDALYTVGSPGSATMTIGDDGTNLVVVSATLPEASEAGPVSGVFSLTRIGNTAEDLIVNYAIGGSATSGTDYQSLTGSLLIPSGLTSAQVEVVPIDDELMEGDETVVLTLTAGTSYLTGGANSVTVTIADDDALEITGLPESSSGAETYPFTLRLASPTATTLTGVIELSFTPTPGVVLPRDDVWFSSGGQSTDFTIPAGSDSAGVLPQINTGTTAGTITMSAVIGNEEFPLHDIQFPEAPPVIQSVEVRQTPTGFDIHIIGFSSKVEVLEATFQFQGSNLGAQPPPLNVDSAFTTWYVNPDSEQTGSTFLYVQPVAIGGDRNGITSVTIQLRSTAGLSSPVSASVNLN